MTRSRISSKTRLLMTVVLILGTTVVTHVNGKYWRDNETLWRYVLHRDPLNPNGRHGLSNIERKRGNLPQSLEHIRKACEIRPLYAPYACDRSEIARELGFYEEAIAAADQAIESSPDLDVGYIKKGLVLIETGHLEAARIAFNDAVRVRPQSSDAIANLAYLEADGSPQKLDFLERALIANPRNTMALNNLAIEHFRAGRIELAVDCLQDALALDPTFQLAKENLKIVMQSLMK